MVRGIAHDFLDELYPGLSKSMVDVDVVVPHQASKVGLMMLERFGWKEREDCKNHRDAGQLCGGFNSGDVVSGCAR